MSSTLLEQRPDACSAPAPVRGRRPMLDLARLAAAYAIVWLHTPLTPEMSGAAAWGRFAVPFFTAAAVLLAWEGLAQRRDRGLGEYARSRFWRIYVPFLAWSGIYLAFKAAKALLLPNQPNDFPGVEVLWLGSFFHLWFMPFILGTTLAVYCLGRPVVGWPRRENVALFAALVVGWQIAWLPCDRSTADASFGQLATDALPAAFWGVALAIVRGRGAARSSRSCDKTAGDCPNFAQSSEQNGTVPFSEAVLSQLLRRPAVGCCALVLAVLLTALVWELGRNRLVENLAGVALLVFALADWRAVALEPLARLGSLAYGIYLSHLLFIKVLHAVEMKLSVHESVAVMIGVFASAAVASTALAWGLSRSRWTRWLVG